MEEEKEINWIPFNEKWPEEPGWYKVKTSVGFITDAPLATTESGKLLWVVPNTSIITHWSHKD